MRRKTLVNFRLRDEEDKSVPLLSLRQNQAITESVLLACADATLEQSHYRASSAEAREIGAFIHQVISGEQRQLTEAYQSLADHTAASVVQKLVKSTMFKAILDRLADNFILWVMIPADVQRRRRWA